jgi:hypothetical protein
MTLPVDGVVVYNPVFVGQLVGSQTGPFDGSPDHFRSFLWLSNLSEPQPKPFIRSASAVSQVYLQLTSPSLQPPRHLYLPNSIKDGIHQTAPVFATRKSTTGLISRTEYPRICDLNRLVLHPRMFDWFESGLLICLSYSWID